MMKKNKIYDKLNNFLIANNARLHSFEYYENVFGNIVLVVEYNQALYEFVTDKGEIYCNNQFVCDNTYHTKGQDDTILKLIEVIEEKLFSGSI